MSKDKQNRNAPFDFYFWLGDDSPMESLTEKEFKEKINSSRENDRKWRDVDVGDGETTF